MILLAGKHLSRRSVMSLLVWGVLLGLLFMTSKRMGELCEGGSYCQDLSNIRHKLPGFRLPHNGENQDQLIPSRPYEPGCDDFPDTSSVLLVMKTGASEAYNKIPTQLMTNLKCVPEYLIFSDMEQEIAGYKILDSLDDVLPDAQTNNPDFDLYHRQKKCLVDGGNCNQNDNASVETRALDKYKSIHMAEKAYKLRPGYKWYLFVDADTYVVWPTLVEWLKHLDPTQQHYLGSAARIGQFPFAHGGSGYVVSHATMSQLFQGKTGVANQWDVETIDECCGDIMFAVAVEKATKETVKTVWPTINDEKPNTLSYGPDQWCQPVATMHHVSSQEVSALNAFEKKRGVANFMRIKDLYHQYLEPRLVEMREDWDNLSEDVYFLDTSVRHEEWELERAKTKFLSPAEDKAHLSFEACRQACVENHYCFQFRYHYGICAISRSFSLGVPMKKEPRMSDKWLSGWDVAKIKAWVKTHDDCGEMAWPQGVKPSIPADAEGLETQGGVVS